MASVEANIQNFEDTKKEQVAKKQFKDEQIANNEIKRILRKTTKISKLKYYNKKNY